jgi:hypothetical protein
MQYIHQCYDQGHQHGIHIFDQAYTKQGMVAVKGVEEQVLFGRCSEAFYAFQ